MILYNGVLVLQYKTYYLDVQIIHLRLMMFNNLSQNKFVIHLKDLGTANCHYIVNNLASELSNLFILR